MLHLAKYFLVSKTCPDPSGACPEEMEQKGAKGKLDNLLLFFVLGKGRTWDKL